MDFIQLVTKYATQIFAHGAKPDLQKAFLDSLSPGQVYSKLGALEIIKDINLKFNHALFIGQWHGLLPNMMFQSDLIQSAVGIEISETWSSISHHINKDWNWTSIAGNIHDPDIWQNQMPDLIVNTSSEHMSFDWMQFVRPGTYVLLQSTNYNIPEHCNIVHSLDEFIERTKMSELIATKEQGFKVYNRYTIFGKK